MKSRDECQRFIELLTDPSGETPELSEHLRRCPECAKSRQALLQAVKEGPSPEDSDLTPLKRKVISALLQHRQAREEPESWGITSFFPAIGFVLVLLLFFWYRLTIAPPRSSDPSAPFETCMTIKSDGTRFTIPLERPFLLATETASVKGPDGTEYEVSGPAAARFSKRSVFLEYGKITIQVAGARESFKAVTPQGAIYDLGTVFTLEVNPGGTAIRVLDGSVRLEPLTGSSSVLIAGQSGTMIRSTGGSSNTSAFQLPTQGEKRE